MSRLGDLGARLQSGETSVNIVGRRRTYFIVSLVLVAISVLGLGVQKLHLGVEFAGGAVFEAPRATISVEEIRETVKEAGVEGEPKVWKLGNDRVRVETGEMTAEQADPVQKALAEKLRIPQNEITTQVVGPSWGSDVTNKALTSLAIFLGLVVLYLAFAFEPKMSAAAVLALLHDLIITIGIYAIVGFEVTPATVIGLLTILGYSLYDTVVVFDKVRENTAGIAAGSRMTYSQAANLAVNQTLARSINTTVVALLPVGGLLFVGAGLLGAGTLKDLALVLFVGMAAGAYSSIFLATPAVAALKEREPAMQGLAKRVAQREASQGKQAAAAAKRTAGGAPSLTKQSRPQEGEVSAPVREPDGATDAPAAPPPRRPNPPAGRSGSGGSGGGGTGGGSNGGRRRPTGKKRP